MSPPPLPVGTNNFAVYNVNASSPSMNNVTASASGGSSNSGVYNNASSPTIENSALSGSGGAFSYGIYNTGGGSGHMVTVDNSRISGNTNTVLNDNEFTTRIGASQLDGGPVSMGGGTVHCAASYNGNHTRLGGDCTPDTFTIIVAKSGGDFTSVQAALDSITNNSTTNHYLVKVGPGTFTETVTMKPFVVIEGASERATKITFAGSASRHRYGGGVEQRRVTLIMSREHRWGSYAIAIYNAAQRHVNDGEDIA